jgi:glycine/D-amino acid oxidase-like deaminating enzyme
MQVDVAPNARPLFANETCDVVVVGSGIAGLSTAYELVRHKLSVIVVDRDKICSGMTARTSAHLAPLCDDLMSEMKKIRGLELCKAFYQSQAAAVDRIDEIRKSEKIACDFRRLDGYLFEGRKPSSDVIESELDVVREVGAPVHRIVGVPLKGCEGRHALRYPNQATFHPLKYLAGLVAASAKLGVRYYSESPVEDISETKDGVSVRTKPRSSHSCLTLRIATSKAALPQFLTRRYCLTRYRICFSA